MELLLLLALVGECELPVSCGATCLYLLVREDVSAVDFEVVSRLLPDHAEGHAFKELKAGAASFGISTGIENVKDGSRTLPRASFIAHFRSAGSDDVGHFVFFRPLEPTFSQYQMIAPPREPEVFEATDLLARPVFSGWVLTKQRTDPRTFIGVLVCILGLAMLLYSVQCRYRAKSTR